MGFKISMSFTYYGEYIKNAREKAGFSMERCAEGICSIQTLYRAENNKAGLSAIVFQAIMSRCGESQEVFPVFKNWNDYECFDAMCKAEMWIRSWQVEQGLECLKKMEEFDFASNQLYFQKWLYYHAYMMNRAGSMDYKQIDQMLKKAIKITKPYWDIETIHDEDFTETEFRILILLSENYISLGNTDYAVILLNHLEDSIRKKVMGEMNKSRLEVGLHKVITLMLLVTGQMQKALDLIKLVRKKAFKYSVEEHYIEIAFIYGMAEYLLGDNSTGLRYMRAACYSADAIKARFTFKGIEWLNMLGLEIKEIQETQDYCPERIDYSKQILNKNVKDDLLEDGDEVVTYGKILKKRRKEQRVSAKIVSQGLCTESYYSKIENDKAIPDVFLARALMQRLGLSDEPFMFFVGKNDSEQYVLERKFAYIEKYERDKIPDLLAMIEQSCQKKDNRILLRWCEIEQLVLLHSKDDRSEAILGKLRESLPDFVPDRIMDYRLGRLEISGLIAYAYALRDEGHITKAIRVFYSLFHYVDSTRMGDIYKNDFYSMVLAKLVNMLGIQDRYDEIIELKEKIEQGMNYTNPFAVPTIYAHVATIYANKNAYSYKEYALYAYYLFVLCDNSLDKKFKTNMEKRIEEKLDYCY